MLFIGCKAAKDSIEENIINSLIMRLTVIKRNALITETF